MRSGQALAVVEFKGRTAHAAYDPWNGRSRGRARVLHPRRQHDARAREADRQIHDAIREVGDIPNVVPDRAKLWTWALDFERKGVDDVLARPRPMAQGAALMAGVEVTLTVQAGDYEVLVNEAGRLLDANLRWLGPVAYTPEEDAFACALQKAAGVEPIGMNAAIGSLEGGRRRRVARRTSAT
jgi:aminobenzoyl-glutamate utilization protein B